MLNWLTLNMTMLLPKFASQSSTRIITSFFDLVNHFLCYIGQVCRVYLIVN